MINIHDYMLGNWVLKNVGSFEPRKVDPAELLLIERAKDQGVLESNYKPIPLNPELMKSLGYTVQDESQHLIAKDGIKLVQYFNNVDNLFDYMATMSFGDGSIRTFSANYLHELQNILREAFGYKLELSELHFSHIN